MPAFAAPFILCLCVMSHMFEGISSIPNIPKNSERPRTVPGKSRNVGETGKIRGVGAEGNVTKTAFVGKIHFICTDVYSGGHRLAEVFRNSAGVILSCNMVGDSKLIKRVLSFIPLYIMDRVSKNDMDQVLHQCSRRPQNFEASFFAQLLDKKYQGIAAFPGTKWCGSGNVARNNEDLGEARDADMCCREHDFAMDSIPPNKSRHGLENKLTYTILRAKQPKNLCRKFKKDISKPKRWRVYDPPNFFTAYFQAKGKGNIMNELWTSE
ncbi:uncharacterized protein LOC119377508 isoform X2 [Rhipicephalus sanguineus]|uniref:uncharacterized protein LOC119376249 isoform X2 n=1 Tax=Rhipicephalus sanguineus TaxID=34632 RepID=UPI001893B2BF|nr:uncharacterized protein LOC119376249 isoform X2 [Rhipicephalus sanguineus]XP_037502863.1 uncharacterized protein LOC119377508 isoform X2 [Rhipicephalus sanguineus]